MKVGDEVLVKAKVAELTKDGTLVRLENDYANFIMRAKCCIIQRVLIEGYEHYQCTSCGQTSWIKIDGAFAWEGFRGLEPTEAAQQGIQVSGSTGAAKDGDAK